MLTQNQEPLSRLGLVAGLLLLGLAAACGGGSRADITGTGDDGGSGSADEQGEIQGYGSVIVNGTRYTTDASTEVRVDGEAAGEDALALGMVVRVAVASKDLGRDGARATSIRFEAALEGQIDAIDLEAETLLVLGTVVQTDQLTRFSSRGGARITLQDLAPGDLIQVSGHRRQGQSLLATLVREREPRSGGYIVRGPVSEHDAASLQFHIDTLIVDYSGAAVIETRDAIEDGDVVEVEGAPAPDGSRFLADRVTELRDNEDTPPARGGRQGVVTALATGSSCPVLDFVLNRQRVRTNTDTRYHGGVCADIEVGRRLHVVGRFEGEDLLVATEVALAPKLNALVLAAVEAVSPQQPTDSPDCTIRVLGDLKIRADRRTRQGQDAASAQGQPGFRCRDVRVGEHLVAIGEFRSDDEGGLVRAALLRRASEFDQAPPEFSGLTAIAGRVQSIDAARRQFSLLGTTVQIRDDTDFGDSSEAEFYLNTRPGDFASATGMWDGSQVQAFSVSRRFGSDFR